MRLHFGYCLGLLAFSYSYFLDGSCAPYQAFITKGVKSAFNLAQAGFDLFNSPSTDKNILQAQQDLVSYMFNAIKSSSSASSDYQYVNDTFASVIKYNINGGNPEKMNEQTYLQSTSDELIFFCD